MPAAVVAGGGGSSRVAAIRSLARDGAPVVALEHTRERGAFRSRGAFTVPAPDPAAAPGPFVDLLLALAHVMRRPSPLFPLDDGALDAVAAGRARLAVRYRSPFPSRHRIAEARLRRRQLDRARALGIPAPRSADAPRDELGFPALVTPGNVAGFRSRFGVPFLRCVTRSELDDAFGRARAFDPIVEEVVPGDELASVGTYVSGDGELRAAFCARRTRIPGRVLGRSGLDVSVTGDVVEQALALLRDLGLHGFAQVDFVRDSRDGVHKVVAVEPRLSRWHGFAAASGIDLARAAYWDLLGARVPSVATGQRRRVAALGVLGRPRPLVPGAAQIARRLDGRRPGERSGTRVG